jgi:rare lipoprotein A
MNYSKQDRMAHQTAVVVRLAGLAAVSLILAGCSGGSDSRVTGSIRAPAIGPFHSTVIEPTTPRSQTHAPEAGQRFGPSKVGKPYVIAGRTYVPRHDPTYDRTGVGSWYGPGFHGRKTANGETYDQHAMTAAHPTLPLNTFVRVTNLENGRSAMVRINDRGPFVHGRIIDLSRAAAERLGYAGNGLARVRVQVVHTAASLDH